MLPTLADKEANTDFPSRGRMGRKCFISNAGPTALMAKAWLI